MAEPYASLSDPAQRARPFAQQLAAPNPTPVDQEDMAWVRDTLGNYARNVQYAKPQASYQTPLSPEQEAAFRLWLKQTEGKRPPFDPRETLQDYDMRGFWQALSSGDPRAANAVNPIDHKVHGPDTWKTPYHQSFSAQSQYAKPNAPVWTADETRLVDPATLQVLFDERQQRGR
jgi:hypothetical protein